MGVPGGMPGTWPRWPRAVAALPPGATWSATGIGRTALPVLFGALAAGGHLRVGMEDTPPTPGAGPVTRNAELVAAGRRRWPGWRSGRRCAPAEAARLPRHRRR